MRPRTYRTWPLRDLAALNDRQAKVPGFGLPAFQASRGLSVGAGGIGSNACQGLVRKGIGGLYLADEDFVEASNLPRQLFGRRDIGKNKAHRLAKRLAREGLFPGFVAGFPCRFQELEVAGEVPTDIAFIICGVDNNPTRVEVARYALTHHLPVIHAGVARDGSAFYCFVQEPGKACFGCALPHSVNDNTFPCNLPGIIDVLQVTAGFIVYAVDTLLCGRHREWNYTEIRLDGALQPIQKIVPRNPKCALCGAKESHDAPN